jgi:large subunit ribosomal protein L21
MEYAIVELQGAQYILKPGETVKVNGTLGQVDANIALGKALAIKDTDFLMGKPSLPDEVTYKVVKHVLSEKVRVGKFTAKSRYRKVNGHRQGQTVLELIGVGKLVKKEAPKTAKKEVAATPAKTPAKKAPAKKTPTKATATK